MSPSARLIAYYIDKNERVVADSVLLKIEDKLPTEVKANNKRLKIRQRTQYITGITLTLPTILFITG